MRQSKITYVLPRFLETGKHNYVVEYPEGQFHFHSGLVHYRKEAIPYRFIPKAANPNDEDSTYDGSFVHTSSLFAQWQYDSP